MIIDTSALVAILRAEPDRHRYAEAIEMSPVRRISAANYLEASIVIEGDRNPVSKRRFDDLIAKAGIEIVPVTEKHARIAREAYRDYGRGSGHRAKLNYGDCFSYALAKESGEPLLFKGNDFAETDIHPAIPSN